MNEEIVKKAFTKQQEQIALNDARLKAAQTKSRFKFCIEELQRISNAEKGTIYDVKTKYGLVDDGYNDERIANLGILESAINQLKVALCDFSYLDKQEIITMLIEYHAKREKEAAEEEEKATLLWVEALGFGATVKAKD